MKVGLFFGSFNPVHAGHLIIANHIAEKVDKVWFVISPQNPLKKAYELSAPQRLELLKLAIKDDNRFQLCDIELGMPVPSYTINTLEALTKLYPENNFSLIIGSDNYNTFSQWKSSDKIVRNYPLLVYERPKFPFQDRKYNAELLDAPLIGISSTYIRTLIKKGKSIRYLVPETVEMTIESNGYYK